MVTIKTVAEKAQVSIGTVSRVINNQKGVGSETRARVKRIIKELEYHPNNVAKSLVTKKSKTIGLIVPDITNPFFSKLFSVIEDYASQYDYDVMLCNTGKRIKKEQHYIRLLIDKCVDGIIITSGFLSYSYKKKFGENIPFVMLDRRLDEYNEYGIYLNNIKGGYDATMHLISLGHSNIAFVSGEQTTKSSQERFQGYKKALEKANLQFKKEFVVNTDYTVESGIKAVEQLNSKYKLGNEITALFMGNDLLAYGAYNCLRLLGYKIPEDISIVGFDDLDMSTIISPKLTTVRQPIDEMGEKAVSMLINIINKKKIDKKVLYYEPELIVRKSTNGIK